MSGEPASGCSTISKFSTFARFSWHRKSEQVSCATRVGESEVWGTPQKEQEAKSVPLFNMEKSWTHDGAKELHEATRVRFLKRCFPSA